MKTIDMTTGKLATTRLDPFRESALLDVTQPAPSGDTLILLAMHRGVRQEK